MITNIENMYKVIIEGNIPAVLAAMDDHMAWNEAQGNTYADDNPYRGPDAVLHGIFARLGA